MTSVLLGVFALQAIAIIGWGMMRRERMIQFPFLVAAVCLGWVLPQLLGLAAHPFLPRGGLEKTILMAILCLAGSWLGYEKNRRAAQLFAWEFNHRRLLGGSAAMTLVGAFFFYQVGQLAAEVTADVGGQWTGIITIYVFFAQLLSFGMALALVLFTRKPDWPTLALVIFGLVFYIDRILIAGRRAAMVELGMMVLLAFWFNRRLLPPRWAMVVTVFLGVLVINSIGDYRSVMLGKDRTTWSGAGVSEILDIDYLGNIKRMATGEAPNFELTNAVMNIAAADRTLRFDFGLSHWNGLVQRYVPAQWVGHEFKQYLSFDLGDQARRVFGHRAYTGTTSTGLSDAFLSFWFFGAFKFLLIGLIMCRWYRAALQGQIVAQLVVILAITPALHAITHSTHSFFVIFLQLGVFLLPVFWFARRRPVGKLNPLKISGGDPNIKIIEHWRDGKYVPDQNGIFRSR